MALAMIICGTLIAIGRRRPHPDVERQDLAERRAEGTQGGPLGCAVLRVAAKSCVAVGVYLNGIGEGVPLAESWSGGTWTRSRPPDPKGSVDGELNKVSCTSAAHCIAVGGSDTNRAGFALADSWNG